MGEPAKDFSLPHMRRCRPLDIELSPTVARVHWCYAEHADLQVFGEEADQFAERVHLAPAATDDYVDTRAPTEPVLQKF